MILKSLRSFKFAFRGLYKVFRYENNAKVHLTATVVVLAAGVYFRLTGTEWLGIVSAIALVWLSETFNTAIETLVDLCHPEFDKKAGAIKDLSAGAVLVAAAYSLTVALIIFLPKIYSYVQS